MSSPPKPPAITDTEWLIRRIRASMILIAEQKARIDERKVKESAPGAFHEFDTKRYFEKRKKVYMDFLEDHVLDAVSDYLQKLLKNSPEKG